LFAKSLLSNDCSIFAYLAVVSQKRSTCHSMGERACPRAGSEVNVRISEDGSDRGLQKSRYGEIHALFSLSSIMVLKWGRNR
jgi:hypothetical protein